MYIHEEREQRQQRSINSICDGYMPAEWHTHRATWLAWPHDKITFPNRIARVEKIFAEIIYHLHQHETVELLVKDSAMKARALTTLQAFNINHEHIIFHEVDYADVWIRDYGPTFLLNRTENNYSWVKWQYNAYGNKFPDLLKDDDVPQQIETYLATTKFMADLIMEGGAIDVNGEGVTLTTEQCLLNPNRNPALSKEQITEKLANYLGSKKIIWLKQGLINDHTDGHIDEIARFVNANTIVCAYTENQQDPNFAILAENMHSLETARDQAGLPFQLIKSPIPEIYYDDGERAPASYANFYIANNLVLVPQFNDPNDKISLNILQELFPTRKVIGIDSTDLIYGGGSIHCITQQQPQLK